MSSAAAPTTPTAVTLDRRGGVLVVMIDNPPVNALGAEVRRGLVEAIDAAEADAAVGAVLLVGAGRNFLAGADIREFGQPAQPPSLPEVCNRIESCMKPVIAAIHGAALGGGLEIALAAHYRLAVNGAKLGLPEVQLGLMPGAGGTQRAPRLIGVAAALELMLGGQPVDKRRAHALGLVDRIGSSADSLGEGLAYALELLAGDAAPRRTRDAQVLADHNAARAALDATRSELAKKYRGLFSPAKIIDAVEAALERPFDEGLRLERGLFLQCIDSPQRQALIHAFLAEREAAKVPEAKRAQPRPINSVGVVGAARWVQASR
jgi:3-hydroxyacyl-CoA dehydrogenase